MATRRPTPPIQSLDRGLILLEAVAAASQPVSLAALTSLLGIDRSSVFRLANTLKQRGFLAQLPGSKDYVLGSAVWRMASRAGFRDLLTQMARPHVNALAAETGETTHLAIREGRQAVLIDHQLTGQPVGVSSGSGFCVPLHCTSVGKALLGDHDQARLMELFGAAPLEAHTARTVTTLAALAEDCCRTRARGYALDDEEHNAGVRCIAAPIRDASGAIVASIGISAPAGRLSRARFEQVGQLVCQAAVAIGARLGTHGGKDA